MKSQLAPPPPLPQSSSNRILFDRAPIIEILPIDEKALVYSDDDDNGMTEEDEKMIKVRAIYSVFGQNEAELSFEAGDICLLYTSPSPRD